MKYRNIQKLLAILPLLCVLLCCTPVRALALTTVLSTNVPDEVSLRVEITGKGTVAVGEKRLSSTGTVTVKRHQPFTVTLSPRQGYRITAVSLNGKSVLSSLKNGKLTVEELNLDGVLSVTFTKTASSHHGSNPKTGDQSVVVPAMASALISMTALVLVLSRKTLLSEVFDEE